jgi:hypothetical protein
MVAVHWAIFLLLVFQNLRHEFWKIRKKNKILDLEYFLPSKLLTKMEMSLKGSQNTCFTKQNYCRRIHIRWNGQETIGITLEKVTGDWDVKFMGILADKIDTHLGDLVGGPAPPPPPLFVRNLPSNVSKTQDLRPKILYLFCYFGGCAPLLFSKFLDPPLDTIRRPAYHVGLFSATKPSGVQDGLFFKKWIKCEFLKPWL